jgi:hypothetical protein
LDEDFHPFSSQRENCIDQCHFEPIRHERSPPAGFQQKKPSGEFSPSQNGGISGAHDWRHLGARRAFLLTGAPYQKPSVGRPTCLSMASFVTVIVVFPKLGWYGFGCRRGGIPELLKILEKQLSISLCCQPHAH